MSLEYEVGEPLELKVQKCLARIEAIDRQLKRPKAMADYKGLSTEEMHEWMVSAETARRATVEELVELRYLLHAEEHDLASQNVTLRKKIGSLEEKLKKETEKNHRASRKIMELKYTRDNLIAKIDPESLLKLSDEDHERLAKESDVFAALIHKIEGQRKAIRSLEERLKKRSCQPEVSSQSSTALTTSEPSTAISTGTSQE